MADNRFCHREERVTNNYRPLTCQTSHKSLLTSPIGYAILISSNFCMPPKRTLSSSKSIVPKQSVQAIQLKREERARMASDFWAFVSICSFPAGMVLASLLGYGTLGSLAWGAVASLSAVIVNVITESKLWIFENKWRQRFEHPEFAFRLAVITGAILLILHTGIIMMVLTDGALDRSLMELIIKRQCVQPNDLFMDLCTYFGRY